MQLENYVRIMESFPVVLNTYIINMCILKFIASKIWEYYRIASKGFVIT